MYPARALYVGSMLALAIAECSVNTHGCVVVGRRRCQGAERERRRLSFLNGFVREEHKNQRIHGRAEHERRHENSVRKL